jgi:hypothetical protein
MKSLYKYFNFENKILANIILYKLFGWPFKKYKINTKRIYSFFLFFFVILTIESLIFKLLKVNIDKTLLVLLFSSSLIGCLSFYVISWAYQYTYLKLKEMGNIPSISERLNKQMLTWVKKITMLWKQLLFSIITITLSLYIINYTSFKLILPFQNNIATNIAFSFEIFGLSHGVYWAILTPISTRIIRFSDFSETIFHPIYPNKNTILFQLSKNLSMFAILDAIIVTLCIISSLFLDIENSENYKLYIILIVIQGYIITSWTFLFPQYNLSKIISKHKKMNLTKISSEIKRIYNNDLEKIKDDNIVRLANLTTLYSVIKNQPITMIDFSGLKLFIGSLITPTIVAIIGILFSKYLK